MIRILIWIGGFALLAAALLDGLGVAGRHSGLPIHGVIELVQAAILIAGSIALVTATLAGVHARVHFMLEKLPPALARVTEIGSDIISALFFAALLIGGLWLARDLWPGHEQSELLGVPYALLRLISNAALAAVAALLVWQAVRRTRS